MATAVTIAADIPWNSGGVFYAITNLKAIDFQPSSQAAVAGFQGALFVDSLDNELKYRTTGGALIKFTNGPNFNFSATGQIGGDYANVAALVDYVDANGLYRMRQEVAAGSQQYAVVQTAGVDLFEFHLHPTVGVPTQRVRLSSPAALVSSYVVTWPGALPGATTLQQIDSTGQTIFSNALAANQSITVSGTGLYKHGTRTMQISAQALVGILGTTAAYPAATLTATMTGATAAVGAALPLEDGKRILAIRIYVVDNATGPTKVNAAFSFVTLTTGVTTDVVIGAASAGTGAQQTLTLGSLTTVITAGQAYVVWLKTTSGSALVTINGIEIDYDQP